MGNECREPEDFSVKRSTSATRGIEDGAQGTRDMAQVAKHPTETSRSMQAAGTLP